ncbi:hypothetical protein B0J12DRAFT_734063 [Macrophomina phaseolina]|uniref:Uncharacterized protein n=1 Tax=Macrophomina phaseolina TaxID=35725 RepID=A0ABQ8GTN0_9PEZI|nr:hypothetical protein B0J12DRAFT_734063 [Macrophomina phaseolina]
MQTRDNELPHGVCPGTSRAAGGVKLAHSVSVRLRRKPRPLAVSSNPETSSSSSTTASPAPAPIAAHPEEATLTANNPTGAETVTDHNTPPLQDEHPPKPEPQITESERLAESWRDLRQREKYLKQKEEALLLGQMRLKQERAAFEMEKCRFNEEQQQRQQRRAPREDESRRKRTSRHSRSQSRPRSKVLPDDSWRRDHRSGKIKDDQQQQHQQDRHSSWSSINSNSTASPSPFPSDSESTTTATTHSTNSFSTRKSTPEHCTWSSPNASLAASYARYNTNWARLSLRSPSIPYPSPNHTSAELRQTSHLPLSVGLTWSSDDIIKYNATCFFLIAHGVPVVPDLVNARPKIGFSGAGLAEDGLKGLVREVRGEMRRWHEDGLKYRSGGEEGCGDGAERKVNEELVRDETARAVFRAFTELRDGLQAEIRWRRENGVAVAAGDETRRRRREEKESDDVETEGVGAGREMDWTVLSEAIL